MTSRVAAGAALLAVLAGGAFWLLARDGGAGSSIARPPPPAPLTEAEVRTYVSVARARNEILGKAALAHAQGEETGSQRAEIDALLRRHHLSAGDWKRIESRVNRVVEALRWEEDAPARRTEILGRLEQVELRLADPEAKDRAKLETEAARLKALLDAPGPQVSDADRELARRFWNDLDRLAPPTLR